MARQSEHAQLVEGIAQVSARWSADAGERTRKACERAGGGHHLGERVTKALTLKATHLKLKAAHLQGVGPGLEAL